MILEALSVSIIIEGLKYVFTKNMSEDDIRKLYVESFRRAKKQFKSSIGYEVILDECKLMNRIDEIVQLRNNTTQKEKELKDSFIKLIENNGIICFDYKELYAHEDQHANNYSIYYQFFITELKYCIVNNQEFFRERILEGMSEVKENIKEVKGDLKEVSGNLKKIAEDQRVVDRLSSDLDKSEGENRKLLHQIELLKKEETVIQFELDCILGPRSITEIIKSVTLGIKSAIAFYNNMDYKKALNVLRRYHHVLTSNAKYRYLIAGCLFYTGEYDKAEETWALLIYHEYDKFVDEKKAKLHYFYAKCLFEKADYKNANIHFAKAYKIEKSLHECLFSMGQCMFQLSSINDEIRDRKVLMMAKFHFDNYLSAINGIQEQACYNLGYINMLLNEFADAIENLVIAYRLTPDLGDKLVSLGDIIACYLIENESVAVRWIEKGDTLAKKIVSNDANKFKIAYYYKYRTFYYVDKNYEEWKVSAQKVHDLTGEIIVEEWAVYKNLEIGSKSIQKTVIRQ